MLNKLRASRVSPEAVLSLEVLARSPAPGVEQTTRFRELLRHFMQRFFVFGSSSGEDVKVRLVQTAFALGMPGFVLALYLYPTYHLPFHATRPYWSQAGDHFFYVLYSMTAMGIITIFEWDLFFPDLLDIFVLSTLPVRNGTLFRARVAAIFLLLGAVLLDSNLLAPLVLPAATDPPHLFRFLAAHLAAVFAAGVFAASTLLAIEGMLLALLGERGFRSIALWIQGFGVVLLLTMLFLYPVLFSALPSLLRAGPSAARWVPPFWFLGIYQQTLAGPDLPLVFANLAHAGWLATFCSVLAAVAIYPLAWWRKTRALVEGVARRQRPTPLAVPADGLLHATLARSPRTRAIWHFIGQNLFRVPRYRMVLVLYGGAGAALVLASVSRCAFSAGHLHFFFSPEGLRATVPILAFWTVSGLRSTFLASADQRSHWIFSVSVGNAASEPLRAAERWVFCCSLLLASAAATCTCMAGGVPARTWPAIAAQYLVAIALCRLLTDVFFLNVTTIPFTGSRSTSATNFALLLIPYLGFFPAIVIATVAMEPWIESSGLHLLAASAIALAAHLAIRTIRVRRLADSQRQVQPDDDEEEFPLRLGLRY